MEGQHVRQAQSACRNEGFGSRDVCTGYLETHRFLHTMPVATCTAHANFHPPTVWPDGIHTFECIPVADRAGTLGEERGREEASLLEERHEDASKRRIDRPVGLQDNASCPRVPEGRRGGGGSSLEPPKEEETSGPFC
jgi:hypothetical protein